MLISKSDRKKVYKYLFEGAPLCAFLPEQLFPAHA